MFGYFTAGSNCRQGRAVVVDLMNELTHEVKDAEDPLPRVTVLNIHDSIGSTFVSLPTAPSIFTVGRPDGPGKLLSERRLSQNG